MGENCGISLKKKLPLSPAKLERDPVCFERNSRAFFFGVLSSSESGSLSVFSTNNCHLDEECNRKGHHFFRSVFFVVLPPSSAQPLSLFITTISLKSIQISR